MGLFLHQPGMTEPIEADHFVLVLAADAAQVRFHDPHGHPYATLPTDAFLAAWKGETIGYRSSDYTVRYAFHRERDVPADVAMRAAVPSFAAWLRGRSDLVAPPGTIGGAEAVHALADQVAAGLPDGLRAHLSYFAIRVGARRLADAATSLMAINLDKSARIAHEQAELVGSLQYSVVVDDRNAAEQTLRALAPTYAQLADALDAHA
jgi:hypothetical protein